MVRKVKGHLRKEKVKQYRKIFKKADFTGFGDGAERKWTAERKEL